MGTWISHLRIAENLLGQLPGLHPAAFAYGSLAPDSGLPNPDWSTFDPPKSVTHLLDPGDDEGRIADLIFYRQYLAGLPADGSAAYAFRLAYFFHLICDNLWWVWIIQRAELDFAPLISEKGIDAWWEMKKDWYGLDHKYVRDHPGSLYWTTLRPAPLPAAHLPFLPEPALHHQMQYIKEFYSTPGDRVLDRPYPYLNEAAMSRFVQDATAALLSIHAALAADPPPASPRTALSLLPPAMLAPYPSPLGDA